MERKNRSFIIIQSQSFNSSLLLRDKLRSSSQLIVSHTISGNYFGSDLHFRDCSVKDSDCSEVSSRIDFQIFLLNSPFHFPFPSECPFREFSSKKRSFHIEFVSHRTMKMASHSSEIHLNWLLSHDRHDGSHNCDRPINLRETVRIFRSRRWYNFSRHLSEQSRQKVIVRGRLHGRGWKLRSPASFVSLNSAITWWWEELLGRRYSWKSSWFDRFWMNYGQVLRHSIPFWKDWQSVQFIEEESTNQSQTSSS
jgi:hypothetical protein